MNVLVVGASRGIGLELVRQYRAAGERVVATARDEEGMRRIRDLDALALLSSRMGSLGLRTNGSNWLYRASKSAVNSVLKDLSFAVQGKGVCVAMHPGCVRTDMGGPQADLSVEQSVSDMRATLASLALSANGSFLNHDGQVLAW